MFCSHCGTEVDTDSTFCFKCGKQIPSQPLIDSQSLSDSALPKSSPPIPETQPQKRLSAMRKAWRGEERLWKTYWLYNVLGVLSIGFVLKSLQAYGIQREQNNQSSIGLSIFIFLLAISFFPYLIWALTSLWKCAFNTRWKIWGYFARAFVVWWCLGVVGIILAMILK